MTHIIRQHLAGLKMREWRSAPDRAMGRTQFGALFGVSFSTIQGWEYEGKVPQGARGSAVMRQMAELGICAYGDWHQPATCTRCEVRSDDPSVARCSRAGCPLAHVRDSVRAA